MQRDGTAADFGAGPARVRDPQGSAHGDRQAPDGPVAGGNAPDDGRAPGFGPAWALLAASEPVQYAPALGIMRPTLKVSVPVPDVAPAEAREIGTAGIGAMGTSAAGTGDDPAAPGRPLRADRPASSPRPAETRRPSGAGQPALLGIAAVLAVAAAGGYLAYGMPGKGGWRPILAADGAPSRAVGDAVAPRTPVAPNPATQTMATQTMATQTVAPRAVATQTAAASDAATPAAADSTANARPVPPMPAARPAEANVAADVPELAEENADAPQDRRSMVRSAQRALTDAGLDPGPVDGLMGPKTLAAVIAFQDRIGVEGDGEIDAALLQRLMAADRLSDDDIPPAHLPVEPATGPGPSATAEAMPPDRSTRQGLLAAFHSVFGGPREDPEAAATALADAGEPAAGIRR